jgi:hypothetical protein
MIKLNRNMFDINLIVSVFVEIHALTQCCNCFKRDKLYGF